MYILDFAPVRIVMILTAALGYAIATILMKLSAQSGNLRLVALLAIVLTVTVAAEIIVMRKMSLGNAYLAVLGVETLVILGFAAHLDGALGLRTLMGGALVFGGVFLVTS